MGNEEYFETTPNESHSTKELDSTIIDELRSVASFLQGECHQWEKEKKGWYETRRRIDKEDGKVVRVQGSGKANEMTKKIYKCINKLELIKPISV